MFLPNVKALTINGVNLCKILMERIYFDVSKCYKIDSSINNVPEWVFIVRLAASDDNKKYLMLNWNSKSCLADELLYDNKFRDLILLTDDEAKIVFEYLSALGKEYSNIIIDDFELIISRLISIIPCEVEFSPLSIHGLFDPKTNKIYIANNTTQFIMLTSLIHEYTHYILNHDREIIDQTYKEYVFDAEENICNEVALAFIQILIPLFYDKLCLLFDTNDIKKFEELIYNSPDARAFYVQLFASKNVVNYQYDNIVAEILNHIISKFNNVDDISNINYEQRTLTLLNSNDNDSLLKWVINKFAE